MKELSLFSGAGGGLLGAKLLGWMHCGYVEINDYCQRVIAQRIEDGILDRAPIFGDINAFIGEGYADAYQGLVDVVTAGFPCQYYSTAARGRQRKSKDLLPETMSVIEIIRPKFALLENTSRKPIRAAAVELSRLGYGCRCAEISSAAVGSIDNRRRYWLYADANIEGESYGTEYEEVASVCRLPKMDWWETEPSVMGMANVLANRVDRLKALGNGQVPIVAATAWELLR